MSHPYRSLKVIGAALALAAVSCRSSARAPTSRSSGQAYRFPSCDVEPVGKFGVRPARSFYLPMRDGVRIAVDVVLPDGVPEGRRIPTVLNMTRYWRAEEGRDPGAASESGLNPVRFWVSHGFAVVVGDVRGTGASFGVWPHHRSRDETRDFGEIRDHGLDRQAIVGGWAGCGLRHVLRREHG
jgi:predicted acyl esterase